MCNVAKGLEIPRSSTVYLVSKHIVLDAWKKRAPMLLDGLYLFGHVPEWVLSSQSDVLLVQERPSNFKSP